MLATAIGVVTDTGRLTGDLARAARWWTCPASLADDGPVYARPIREPADLVLLRADRAETLPRPTDPDALRATVLRMVGLAQPVRQDAG